MGVLRLWRINTIFDNFKKDIHTNSSTLKHLCKASPTYLCVNVVNTAVNSFFVLFQMIFYQRIIDFVLSDKCEIKSTFFYFCVYYLLAAVLCAVNDRVVNNYNLKENIKITFYFKKFIYSETVKNELDKYNNPDYKNKLYNSVYNDGNFLLRFLNNIISLINAVITFIGITSVFFSLNPYFVVAAIFAAVKGTILSHKSNKVDYQKYQDNLPLGRFKDYINNIFYLKDYTREIRFFPLGMLFRKKYDVVQQLVWKVNKKSLKKIHYISVCDNIIDCIIYAANILVLAYLLVNNSVTVGEFSMVLTSYSMLVNSFQSILQFFISLNIDARYINDVNMVLNSKKVVINNVFPNEKDRTDVVICENISYSYDGGYLALKNVNIEIPLKKKIAIVGENGSGKSTFIKIIAGLLYPDSGTVAFYTDSNVNSPDRLFSIMFQDYNVYAMSVADNICSDDDTRQSKKLAEEGLKFCGLEEKVSSLPHGIDTELTGEFSDGGVSFSGGEQQRIALARAYAKDGKFLVLDEPSSNLDAVSEKYIMDKIGVLINKKSVFFITHNMLNAIGADIILYFENGEIVEHGSPESLLNMEGKFYKMYQSQKSGLELSKYGGKND